MRLGLAATWPQFTLLVVVNALAGGMVGLSTTALAGGALTFISGLLAARWITETHRHPGTALSTA